MKRLYLFVFLLFAGSFFTGCKPSGKSAAQYNNRMIRYQLKVVESQKALSEAINRGKNVEEMKDLLNKFAMDVKNGTDSISSMEPFDGKDEFKRSALNYLGELNNLGQNEYLQLVKIHEIPDSLLTRDDEKKARDLDEVIKNKTDNAFKGLEAEQSKFSKEYNFVVKGN